MEYLRKEAKDLLDAHRRGDRAVLPTLRNLRDLRGAPDDTVLKHSLTLQAAQLCLAMEYGFRNWGEMKNCVEDARVGAAANPVRDVEELSGYSNACIQMLLREVEDPPVAALVAAVSPACAGTSSTT